MRKTWVSGEVSTSVGNTILNLLAWKWVARKLKLENTDIIVEGDDSLIGLNELVTVEQLKFEYSKLGFDADVTIRDGLVGSSFCK